jgi:hypothetical protein
MRDIRKLLAYHSFEEWVSILGRATEFAEKNPEAQWIDFQNHLKIGAEEAFIIQDWLADHLRVKPRISNHWIRCGRLYVLNNMFPSVFGMMERLRIGEQTAFQIMFALQKKGVIKILSDFSFERQKASTDEDLVRQLKRVAKKYRGRCEPSLLMRILYLDEGTAKRLSEYGAKELGLRPAKWRNR